MNEMNPSSHQTITVNHSGGTARQFKVQIQEAATKDWRQHSSHHDEAAARKALDALSAQGCRARVVHYRLPSAA